MKAQIHQTLRQESSLYIALKPGVPLLDFSFWNIEFIFSCNMSENVPALYVWDNLLITYSRERPDNKWEVFAEEAHKALLVNRREFLNSLKN